MTAENSTVYIIDDDESARVSLAMLVRTKGLMAETFESAEDFIRFGAYVDQACVVADFRMPGMSGIELQEMLLEKGIDLPIIVVSAYADVPHAVRAMQNGAVVFLEKPYPPNEILLHIFNGLERRSQMLRQRQERTKYEYRLKNLTPSELDVMKLIVKGLANKVTASKLDLGLRTVELRRAKVLEKMQADSVAELVRMATILGLDSDSRSA